MMGIELEVEGEKGGMWEDRDGGGMSIPWVRLTVGTHLVMTEIAMALRFFLILLPVRILPLRFWP